MLPNRTVLYVLIFVVLFFLTVDIITLLMRGPNFDVVYYDSDIFSDYSKIATITTVSGLKFKSEKKESEYINTYKETSKETFEKYFSQVSKEIGKDIKVLDVDFSWRKREGILEITEKVTLSGLVQNEIIGGKEIYILDMGKVKMNAIGNANLKVHLPDDAVLITVEPTPTTQSMNFVVWSGNDILYFPEIKYKRGE
ncbi:hypothetical protein AS161_07535 [Fervidobacterium sp. 2310opik-2]|nr:hypothetical protein AS161_07535 [Fervidobacterium sp. 2310opik-2]